MSPLYLLNKSKNKKYFLLFLYGINTITTAAAAAAAAAAVPLSPQIATPTIACNYSHCFKSRGKFLAVIEDTPRSHYLL